VRGGPGSADRTIHPFPRRCAPRQAHAREVDELSLRVASAVFLDASIALETTELADLGFRRSREARRLQGTYYALVA
jgi:hypothetical protein